MLRTRLSLLLRIPGEGWRRELIVIASLLLQNIQTVSEAQLENNPVSLPPGWFYVSNRIKPSTALMSGV